MGVEAREAEVLAAGLEHRGAGQPVEGSLDVDVAVGHPGKELSHVFAVHEVRRYPASGSRTG